MVAFDYPEEHPEAIPVSWASGLRPSNPRLGLALMVRLAAMKHAESQVLLLKFSASKHT